MLQIDGLKTEIGRVSDNVERIERLHTSALVSFNEQQSRDISSDLARLKAQTQAVNMNIKNRIKELDIHNARLPTNDPNRQMRLSQVES